MHAEVLRGMQWKPESYYNSMMLVLEWNPAITAREKCLDIWICIPIYTLLV